MTTNILIKEHDIKVSISTKQFEVGLYIMITINGEMQQGISMLKEKDYHISVRKKALKNGDKILDSTVLDYKGKFLINKFYKE